MLLTIADLSLLVQMALGQPIDPVMTLVSILPMIQSLDVVSLLRAIVSMGSAPLVATFSAYVTWPRSGCLVRSAARPPSPPALTLYSSISAGTCAPDGPTRALLGARAQDRGARHHPR